MVNLRERVSVEMENISIVLEELEKTKHKPDKTSVELAGIAHFYIIFTMELRISLNRY